MSIFESIAKDCEKVGSGKSKAPFLGVGKYHLRLDETYMGLVKKPGKNEGKTFISAKFTILDIVSDGAGHTVGQEVGWMTMGAPSKMNKAVGQLLIGILGITKDEITPDHAQAFVDGALDGTPFLCHVVDDSYQIKDKATGELVFNEDGTKKMFTQTVVYGERALTKKECSDYDIPEEILNELE